MKRLEEMGYTERELFLMGYPADEAERLAPVLEDYSTLSGAGMDLCFALARSELDRRWLERLTARPWWKFWGGSPR